MWERGKLVSSRLQIRGSRIWKVEKLLDESGVKIEIHGNVQTAGNKSW